MKKRRKDWHAGRTFQAGELIFEATAKRDRPKWAARILRLVLECSDADRSDFEQVLSVADDPTQWSHGRLAFRELCDAGLRFQKTYDRRTLSKERLINVQEFNGLLALAEVVKQITYNASSPPDPFEDDLGVGVASFLMTSCAAME